MTSRALGTGVVIGRAARAVAVVLGRGALIALAAVSARVRGERPAVDRWLSDAVVALGPAYVKVAQLLSTRADVLPLRWRRALAPLHDRARPVPSRSAVRRLRARFGGAHPVLVRAGSIACVYRLVVPGRGVLAVKVRKPGVERALAADLALVDAVARVVARWPALRGAPVVEVVEQVGERVLAQLDLAREAELLDGFRDALREVPGVFVPRVDRLLSTDDMVVMEYVDGLDRRRPGDLGERERRAAVASALRAVYRMLFVDGVVHCDLHPGNLYFRPDGTVVLLDAGFAVRLPDAAREKFAAFFYCLGQGDGEACADIVLSTATPARGADPVAFRADLAALVAVHAGRRAGAFDLAAFAAGLFDAQRRHGYAADPRFAFPILSLLVLEGTVREFDPDADFQRLARPYLTTALMERALIGNGAR
ncbi:ABC1 kinase family protein [Actinosynnema sp. NPDC053489]|uniref:ABC1 kinase family protein n=1 Tax=Actinosynnema sp. NPDC053489 TaxID=3363916 RepID=UPI0037C53F6F